MSERVVIGNAELWHGDCREVMPLLPRVDLLLTDPPYGIGFAGQPTKWQRRAGQQAESWDDEPITDAVIDALRALAAEQIIWGGNYYRLPPSRGWLVWRKPDAPPSMADLELAWTSFNANAKALDCSISSTNRERVGHPTQKPLRVIAWSLSFARGATSVLDPFMGSGTTGCACATTGHRFIGIERDRRYFDIACERILRAQAQGSLLPAEVSA